jgi:hypothetical protein
MKIIARLVLFVFFSFLITPTVICIVKRTRDIAVVYSFSEEEKSQNEITAIINFVIHSEVFDLCRLNSKPLFALNLPQEETIFCRIFIPPPQEV